MSTPLAQGESTGLGAGARQLIGVVLREGQAAWPRLALPPERARAFLERAYERAGRPTADAWRPRAADLHLACACAEGRAAAIAAFERTYFAKIDVAVASLRARSLDLDEVKQLLRCRLFVRDKAGGKIDEYSGRGELWSWVRTIAMRIALDLLAERGRERPIGDLSMEVLAPATLSPELEYLKQRYRAQVDRALAEALRTLSPRERNVLRQHLLDGLGLDELGRLYGVHRVTVSRWLAGIRRVLSERTRDRVMRAARLAPGELESVVRLVRSQISEGLRPLLESSPGS